MPTINLSVPEYIYLGHFLPLLKQTAYVWSGPSSPLNKLQCHSVTFTSFPVLRLTYSLCCFHFLTTILMHFIYAFQCFLFFLSFFFFFGAIKRVYKWFLIWYAFPKLVLNPQAMSSLLFFHQSIPCLDFWKPASLNLKLVDAFTVAHHFFLNHVDSNLIIRMNISDMHGRY